MEKQAYITEEGREKCRRVIDAFAELYEMENEDMLVVDAVRYGFVKLQCYTPSYGFEEFDTYTDSHSIFEGIWDEWLNLNLFLIAIEMQLNDIVGEEVFNILSKEKQLELIGEKADFEKKAGITP